MFYSVGRGSTAGSKFRIMIGKLTIEEMEELLTHNNIGRIGCNDGKKTYVVPVNYVYDGKYILTHAVLGDKINIMRKKPDVCFEVDEIKSFTNWKSVIAWGTYQELEDERDRYYAMKLFTEKMIYTKISDVATPPVLVVSPMHRYAQLNIRPIVYRIVITEKTGRYENG